jgi:hypothetical protein
MVAIVQLVRTPGCGPGGRGFKSHWSPQKFLPLSSRGLGHGLFKPGTRVRISLGALCFKRSPSELLTLFAGVTHVFSHQTSQWNFLFYHTHSWCAYRWISTGETIRDKAIKRIPTLSFEHRHKEMDLSQIVIVIVM